MRRFYFILMIVVIMVNLHADGTPAEGSGTESDPYLIETLDNLLWLSTTEAVWDSIYYFLQTEDIDASDTQNWNDGKGFEPIGYFSIQTYDHPFQGNYNGDHNIIEGLFIDTPTRNYVGLFGFIEGATISDLGLTNVEITGSDCVGGLVGNQSYYSHITNCYVTGNVSGINNIGGLTGRNLFNTQVTNSYAACDIEGELEVGGLFGRNIYSANNCYYDYETCLINGQQLITFGALTHEMFTDWIENDFTLDINNYLMEEDDQYLINDLDDFHRMLAFGQNPELSFRLTSDLDLVNDQGFYIPCLQGTFNGDGHIVDNLDISVDNYGVGLFGIAYGAEINDLGATNANVTGFSSIGALVGYNHESIISSSFSSGFVNCETTAGGLVGSNRGDIINCWSEVVVCGSYCVGGLTGWCWNGTIRSSFAGGAVSGDNSIGGLAGSIESAQITDCYAKGTVTGTNRIGGLIGDLNGISGITGEATILSDCYASGLVSGVENTGGFVGETWDENYEISNCIWNTEATGQATGIGWGVEGIIINLLGFTTVQMQMMSTYTDISWDFVGESVNGIEDIWDIDAETNEGFPYIYDIEFPSSEDGYLIEKGNWKIENYPNPFNPVTNICFEIGEDSEVLVNIYNLRGQKVETLVDGYFAAGKHSIIWNADNHGSGMYLVNYQAKGICDVKKVILLK